MYPCWVFGRFTFNEKPKLVNGVPDLWLSYFLSYFFSFYFFWSLCSCAIARVCYGRRHLMFFTFCSRSDQHFCSLFWCLLKSGRIYLYLMSINNLWYTYTNKHSVLNNEQVLILCQLVLAQTQSSISKDNPYLMHADWNILCFWFTVDNARKDA